MVEFGGNGEKRKGAREKRKRERKSAEKEEVSRGHKGKKRERGCVCDR